MFRPQRDSYLDSPGHHLGTNTQTSMLDLAMSMERVSLKAKNNSTEPIGILENDPLDDDYKKMERSISAPNDSLEDETNKIDLSRYKTELCRSFTESAGSQCKYGSKCQFAHGEKELRPLLRHPKYKTQLCSTYHSKSFCPYGPRCTFIHEDNKKDHSIPVKVKARPKALSIDIGSPSHSSCTSFGSPSPLAYNRFRMDGSLSPPSPIYYQKALNPAKLYEFDQHYMEAAEDPSPNPSGDSPFNSYSTFFKEPAIFTQQRPPLTKSLSVPQTAIKTTQPIPSDLFQSQASNCNSNYKVDSLSELLSTSHVIKENQRAALAEQQFGHGYLDLYQNRNNNNAHALNLPLNLHYLEETRENYLF